MASKGQHWIVVGTKKGLFILQSGDRRTWRTRGPFFPGLPVYHAALDPRDGRTVWASVTSDHWGPPVQWTKNLGAKWERSPTPPKYPQGSGLSVDRVWHVEPGGASDGVWAGVEPAGLFHSGDAGKTWHSIESLNAFPGREKWIPGGGGLCLHTILPYPGDAKKMLVAASAVGVFGTGDRGRSWRLMNGGIHSELLPAKSTGEDQPGSCVHKIVRDAKNPDVVYMQNHWGVYRRKRGDAVWTDIARGLPSRFGFPMAAHPHDGGTVYTVPLEADTNRVVSKGSMAVWRTRDGGKTWQRLSKGLPQKDAWFTILREGLATDDEDPAGVYVGTTTGQLYASRDGGEAWSLVTATLPPILSVSAGRSGHPL